jgi:CTP:phosphocholine cytidylyltransferase-like protein
MNEEAPETIYDSDNEYIRKDIYDEPKGGGARNIFKDNEPDSKGIMIKKEAISNEYFEDLKISGVIEDYAIDEQGVKVIKKFKLLTQNRYYR